MAVTRNLARTLSVNFIRLTLEVIKELPRSGFDIDSTVTTIRNRIWGDDLTEEQKRDQLFGDAPWDELKMAVLDARYLTLPDDQLPTTRDELLGLCRRLLRRNGDDDLAMAFVLGWAGNRPPAGALDQFVDDLWEMRLQDAGFFNAVVSGRHDTALASIAERSIHQGIDDAAAIRVLTRMALIWAAFDSQATTARVKRSMTRPLGWLIVGAGRRTKAATIATVFRPIGETFETIFRKYRATGASDRQTNRPRIRRPEVADIRDRVRNLAQDLERDGGEFAMDAPMSAAWTKMQTSPNPLIEQLRKQRTDRAFGSRQMSEVWYGLLPLQAVGLVAMRLAQMEQMLEPLLRDAVGRARKHGRPVSIVVPDFDAADLAFGWRGRVRTIVDALRTEVLKDDDHHSVRKARHGAAGRTADLWQGAAHDDSYIDAVESHFTSGSRTEDIVGGPLLSERQQALDLLDVATEQRFQLFGTGRAPV